jgi:hypothetical protein
MHVVHFENTSLYLMDSLWDRTRGVMGRESFLSNGAFLIPSCNWVHTFFVSVPLQLFFLNERYEIVKHIPSLSPNRFSPYVYHAALTLECMTGVPIDRVRAMLYHLRTYQL